MKYFKNTKVLRGTVAQLGGTSDSGHRILGAPNWGCYVT